MTSNILEQPEVIQKHQQVKEKPKQTTKNTSSRLTKGIQIATAGHVWHVKNQDR